MVSFEFLDFVVIGVFALLLLGLGVFTKLRDNTLVQMLLAGRSLTMPVYVATFVSFWYGGILGTSESVALYGGTGAWTLFCANFYVFLIAFAFMMARKIRDNAELGLAERLEKHFGSKVAKLTSWLIYTMALPAAQILTAGMMVDLFTGWGLPTGILLTATVTTLFVIKGGMVFDARVSMLACALMLVGFVGAFAICMIKMSPIEMYNGLKPEFKQWDSGNGWVGLVSLLFFGVMAFADPAVHQKVGSAINSKVSRNGLLVSIGIWLVFDAVAITLGLYGVTFLEDPLSSPAMLIPRAGFAILPVGWRAIFLCGIAAAVFTAAVNYLLICGTTLGQSINNLMSKRKKSTNEITWSRVGMFLSAALACVLALNVQSMIEIWFAWCGCALAALLFPILMAYSNRSRTAADKSVVFAGMVGGYLVALAWLFYSKQAGHLIYPIKVAEGQTWLMTTTLPGLVGYILSASVARLYFKIKGPSLSVPSLEPEVILTPEKEEELVGGMT